MIMKKINTTHYFQTSLHNKKPIVWSVTRTYLASNTTIETATTPAKQPPSSPPEPALLRTPPQKQPPSSQATTPATP